jgi:N-acetylglutamate synthase-like GNAT family acetyltransferase
MTGIDRIAELTHSQTEDLHRLYQNEWWAKGRSLAQVRSLLQHSDVIVAFCDSASHRLVAFARALTDRTIKALVLDVIVDRDYRDRGLGKVLFDAVVSHSDLQDVQHLELYCLSELVPFYERWGFTDALGTLHLMRLTKCVNP